MTNKELETRVAALEQKVTELQAHLAKCASNGAPPAEEGPWWQTTAGRFANDPVFDEIVRLGREYRESQHPDYAKKKRKPKNKPTKKNARS